jgi:antitoxin ParD1/3/4
MDTKRAVGWLESHHKYDKVCDSTFSVGYEMATIDRMTITLPSEMAEIVKAAVGSGDYASASEVVREALRDWRTKRALQLQELAALKADIDKGLTDVAEGSVADFDTARFIERGRKLLATRSRSA